MDHVQDAPLAEHLVVQVQQPLLHQPQHRHRRQALGQAGHREPRPDLHLRALTRHPVTFGQDEAPVLDGGHGAAGVAVVAQEAAESRVEAGAGRAARACNRATIIITRCGVWGGGGGGRGGGVEERGGGGCERGGGGGDEE